MKLWCLRGFSSRSSSTASQRVTTYIKSPDSHGGTETTTGTDGGRRDEETGPLNNFYVEISGSEKLKSAGPSFALKEAN